MSSDAKRTPWSPTNQVMKFLTFLTSASEGSGLSNIVELVGCKSVSLIIE
jgi:hypothetical protein